MVATLTLIQPVRARVVLHYLGLLMASLAGMTLVPLAVALLAGDRVFALRLTVILAMVTVAFLGLGRVRAPSRIQANEALVVIALLFIAGAGAMTWPFMAHGVGLLDALFESTSAITTTGLSTLASVEERGPAFLFARAWMQWYGGLAIVVLALALILSPGVVAKRLAQGEVEADDLIGGTRRHAIHALAIYSGLTVAAIVLLLLAGAGPFDALVHALAAISTGGFSSRDASIAALGGWPLRAAVTAAAVAGAVSFMLYYAAMRHGWRHLLADEEARTLVLTALLTAAGVGAFMAMDPFSGRVLAMQGGFSYQHSVFNRATQAKRQPGSAFKPFVYAAALDAGFTPATIVLDAPVVVRQDATEDWRPKNSSGKFYGPTPMRVGLELSRNLMTVRIAQQVGMDRVAVYAERFGVYKDMPLQLSYALGAGEVTLNNLVAAYGMFLNGGKKVVPTVVDRVQDRHGKTLYSHDPRSCKGCDTDSYAPDQLPMLFDRRSQIMNPVTAFQLVSMLEGVVQRGTGRRTVGGLDFPVAGKTGTTNDSKDAWFIGFSPSIVAGCFIGYDNPRSLGRHAYGGTLCGPVFREFMKAAMEGQPPGEFRAPTWEGMVTVKLDRNSGERLPDDAEGPNVISESFRAGSEPALYERAAAIAGDDALFGVYESDLPYTLNDLAGTSEAADGAPADNGRPKPPGPPKPTGVGLGTGGLY